MTRIASFLNQSGEARRFAFGLIWSMLGTVAVRLTPLVTTILLSRFFTIEIVGKFAVAYGTLMSAGMLAATGVSLMAMRNIAAEADERPEFTGRIAGLALILAAGCGAVLALLFFIFAKPIASGMLGQPELAGLLALVAPVILLNAFSQVQMAILSGLQRFKEIARINVFYGLALIVGVPTGLMLYGLEGCFAVMGLCTLAQIFAVYPIMTRSLAFKGITVTFAGALSEWPLITRFAIPALLASLLFEPVGWICTAIIVGQPDGLAEVGVYYIAMQLETLLLFVPQIVVQVIIPMLSKGFGAGDRHRVLAVLGMSIGTNLVIAIGFIGFMYLFGDLVLGVFKLDLASHGYVLLLAVANAAVMAAALPLGPIPSTSGYTWTGLVITAGWAATFIAGTWLMRDQGAEGAMTARLIAWSAQSVIYVFFTRYAISRACRAPTAALQGAA